MKHTVSMPLFVMMPRKTMPDKKRILNLNYFLHWKPIVSNMIKKEYAAIAIERLAGVTVPEGKMVGLVFTLRKGSRRRIDRANPLSIHEKFFCDAMVEAGVIPDDNDDHIAWTHYQSGPMDKENPRVEIEIQVIA
jgi:hypothetical protein